MFIQISTLQVYTMLSVILHKNQQDIYISIDLLQLGYHSSQTRNEHRFSPKVLQFSNLENKPDYDKKKGSLVHETPATMVSGET